MKEAFSKFGAVSEARVVPTGRIRPFAFVNFETEADAAKAMAAMQGKSLTTQPLTVEYASAGPRKEKKPKAPKQAGDAAQKPKKEKKAKQPAAGGEAAAAAGDAPVDGEKKKKKPRTRKPKKAANGDAAAPAASGDAAPAEPAADASA